MKTTSHQSTCDHPREGALGLPREVRSLCPECHEVIPGSLYQEDNKVFMAKSCPEHGDVLDLIASRADLFLRNERLAYDDSVRIENPNTQDPAKPIKSPQGYIITKDYELGRFGGFIGDCSDDKNWPYYWQCMSENSGNGFK